MGRDTLIEKEVIRIHNEYSKAWHALPEDLNKYDDFILDLLNELEDIYNPSRINGN